MSNKLYVLGIRGVPAQHGGFETFAEKLSLFLHNRSWIITVYCQEVGSGKIYETKWKGVRRIHIPVRGDSALSTIIFDWKATRHAMSEEGLFLTLGYNTAVFNIFQLFKRQVNVINMDGIEWKREKWGVLAKIWFWLNERVGCYIGSHLVADHPRIKDHLASRVSERKITMIPYGAEEIIEAYSYVLSKYGLKEGGYSIIIARPEPENSFLEMVRAFSSKERNHKLVVLGNFLPEQNPYHKAVIEAASEEVIFPGAIYDKEIVQALRFYARFYLHGHRVGGTNPSLVEALGAGCAVIAHDNHFNRWVAGDKAAYFSDETSCASLLDTLLHDDQRLEEMKAASRARHLERFTWDQVLNEYEQLFIKYYPSETKGNA